jgi:hypothetical protein
MLLNQQFYFIAIYFYFRSFKVMFKNNLSNIPFRLTASRVF